MTRPDPHLSQAVLLLVSVGSFLIAASASSPRPMGHPMVVAGVVLGLACIARGLYLGWKEMSGD